MHCIYNVALYYACNILYIMSCAVAQFVHPQQNSMGKMCEWFVFWYCDVCKHVYLFTPNEILWAKCVSDLFFWYRDVCKHFYLCSIFHYMTSNGGVNKSSYGTCPLWTCPLPGRLCRSMCNVSIVTCLCSCITEERPIVGPPKYGHSTYNKPLYRGHDLRSQYNSYSTFWTSQRRKPLYKGHDLQSQYNSYIFNTVSSSQGGGSTIMYTNTRFH